MAKSYDSVLECLLPKGKDSYYVMVAGRHMLMGLNRYLMVGWTMGGLNGAQKVREAKRERQYSKISTMSEHNLCEIFAYQTCFGYNVLGPLCPRKSCPHVIGYL